MREGVTIVGFTNLPSQMAFHASQLYSRNVLSLLQHLAPGGELTLDFEDEITAGACVAGKPEVAAPARAAPEPPPAADRGGIRVNLSLVIELTILALAIFLGFEVISKVPAMLHTPLMSGTNFIHGIVIVGAIIVLGEADDTFLQVIGFVAMVLATANVVGGWFVTDRMLEMFKKRPEPKKESTEQ